MHGTVRAGRTSQEAQVPMHAWDFSLCFGRTGGGIWGDGWDTMWRGYCELVGREVRGRGV